jgi:hypothetical protein
MKIGMLGRKRREIEIRAFSYSAECAKSHCTLVNERSH